MSADAASPLEAIVEQLAELRDQITILEEARARDVERFAKLEKTVAKTEKAVAKKKQEGYEPEPAPRWWRASAEERREAIGRLRAWVETVFRPGYGHLAAKVRPCWDQHDLCLYVLDWLSESWTVIHQPDERDVGLLWTSMDWHTRFLPVAVSLLEAETESCDHLAPEAAVPAIDPFAGTP
jgi:hypothetical protein